MKICHISDNHNFYDFPLHPADILIHSGDAVMVNKIEQYEVLEKFFSSVRSQYKEIIFVPGNHDLLFQRDPVAVKAIVKSASVLIDQGITMGGVNFWGTPWSYSGTSAEHSCFSFVGTEQKLEAKWSLIPWHTDVLIAHSPPHGVLDQNIQGEHCGSPSLRKRIYELPRLKCVLFGHIHNGSGIFTDPTTGVTYSNGCVLGDDYKFRNPPRVLEVSDYARNGCQ